MHSCKIHSELKLILSHKTNGKICQENISTFLIIFLEIKLFNYYLSNVFILLYILFTNFYHFSFLSFAASIIQMVLFNSPYNNSNPTISL